MSAWTEKEPIVSIKNVHKSFGALEVLRGVSLEVMKGEVICIIGPSGSGKSTLIRCINRMEEHQKGVINVHGTDLTSDLKDIETIRSEVGMVF